MSRSSQVSAAAESVPFAIRPQGGDVLCRLLGGAFFIAGGPAGLWWLASRQTPSLSPWFVWGLGAVMVFLGLDQLAGLANRIVIGPGFVEKRSVWGRTRLAVADIAGYRVDDGWILIEPRGRKLVRVALRVTDRERHPALAEWLGQFDNLDAVEYEAAQARADRDPELGSTVEQRRLRLSRLGVVCWLLNVAGIAVAIWVFTWPEPYWIAVLAAAACPPLAVLLALARPAWFRLASADNSIFPNLFALLVTPLAALTIRAMDIQLLQVWPAIGAGMVIGGVLAWLIQALTPSEPASGGERLMLWLLGCVPAIAYAFGVLVLANVYFDDGAPARAPQRIERATQNDHRYDLTLAPWSARHGTVEAGARFYRSVQAGGVVCINSYRGALGLGWWRLAHCSDAAPTKR